MKIYRISIAFLCMFITFGIENVLSIASEHKELMYNNVIKIDINANGPSYLEHQRYDYTTSSTNEIGYILNYLNSFFLIDDGKIINANDVSSYSVKIYMTDSSIHTYGFYCGRFYDNSNKQYAIDNKEYNCFLDFIYALKTGKIVLDEDITFDPSAWAKIDINNAIENGFVPKRNQINYQSYITRLEACQLFSNFLHKTNNINVNEVNLTPFSDTNDKDVLMLHQLKIINGKSETEFLPYDFITREELAKMLSNTNQYINSKIKRKLNDFSYADNTSISAWAIDSVNDMTSLDILTGNENGEFEPKKYATKEQLIITLLRLSYLSS